MREYQEHDEELEPLFSDSHNNDNRVREHQENDEELEPLFSDSHNNDNHNGDSSLFTDNYFNSGMEDYNPAGFVREAKTDTSEIKNKDSNFVLFFGTGGAGKTMLLSTMLYALNSKYGMLGPNKNISNTKKARRLLASFLSRLRTGELQESTERDEVTRLDLTFYPNNRSEKVKPVDFTFLETSGENHNEIANGGDYKKCIEQYLNANISMSIILTVGYNEAYEVDPLCMEFVRYLLMKGKNLKKINFILAISKWDLSGSEEGPSEEELDAFIKETMPMTYQFIDTYNYSRTYYTIGKVKKAGNLSEQDRIVSLNFHTAENLAKWLYKSVAGIDVEYEGTIWEQLKWSIFK